jgi:MoxR-like ATPase
VEWSDLRRAARPALIHRLFLSEEAAFSGISTAAVLDDLLRRALPE